MQVVSVFPFLCKSFVCPLPSAFKKQKQKILKLCIHCDPFVCFNAKWLQDNRFKLLQGNKFSMFQRSEFNLKDVGTLLQDLLGDYFQPDYLEVVISTLTSQAHVIAYLLILIYRHAFACLHDLLLAYTQTHTHICMHAHMHTHAHRHTHTHTHTHTHKHTHTQMHTHTQLQD